MNSVELLILVLIAGAALTIIGVRTSGVISHMPSTQVLIGFCIGLLAAFVVLSIETDIVPDDLEWIGTVGLAVVLIGLIVGGAYAAFRR